MQSDPPPWTHIETQTRGHMHKFTCLTHTDTSVQARTHTGIDWRSAQRSKSYLCFYVLCFPLSLSFSHLLSPCAITFPLSAGASVICRQSWEKFWAKSVPLVFGLFGHFHSFLQGSELVSLLCIVKITILCSAICSVQMLLFYSLNW